MENKEYVIYKHTNLINGKVYIGQTNQIPKYRWGGQGQNYKTGHFHAAIEKYGWDNFSHEILYTELTADEANELEEKLIKQYNSTNPNYGYNSDKGGKNRTPNKYTRQLQSQSAMNRPIVTDKTKEKLSLVGKGLIRTEKQKARYSEAAKKREAERNGMKYRSVKCLNTGEIFSSLRAAANWCGLVGVSGISSVCRGGKQKTAGAHPETKEKLRWEYV